MRSSFRIFTLMLLAGIAITACNTKSRYVDVTGKVLDEETGQPVAGVTVSASSIYYENKINNSQSAVSDGNGEFYISKLKLAFPESPFKHTKIANLGIDVSSSNYSGYELMSYEISKKTTKFFKVVNVVCLASGSFSFNISSGVMYDKAVVSYWRDGSDEGVVYTAYGTAAGFNRKIPSGNKYRSYFRTKLYLNSALVKTQIDTVKGMPCGGAFNYTININ